MLTTGRRGVLRRWLLAGAASLLACPPIARAQSRKPDILFILADDLGFADLGCYGRRGIATPVLDRLAREGARLTQAYANSAVCSASRTAIITGRYQDRIEVGLEEPVTSRPGTEALSLPPELPTLPRLFHEAGYRTALFGKWHLAGGEAGPLNAGYDYFYGFHGGATDYFRRPTKEQSQDKDEPSDALYEDETVIQDPGYLTDLLGAAVIRHIGEIAREQPLMLSLHFNAPHWPWEGPNDEAVSKTIKVLRQEDAGNEAVFGQMVERMDQVIGKVLGGLDRAGRGRDAIVIFTSDNGGERFSDTWPLTGMKGELLEGGIRVPAIVRWPGRITAGRVVDQLAMGMDWLPTLLAAAEIAPAAAFRPDGENLMPALRGLAPNHPRKVFWRFKASDQAAVRDGDWKYLRLGGKDHLFNIAADERERADRKALEPAIFKRLKTDYDAWNRTMLPYPLDSASEAPKAHFADRY